MANTKIDTKIEIKRTPDIQTELNEDLSGLVITFRHGETIKVDVGDLSKEIQSMALLHGLKQKIVDAAAISRNTETGRSATIEDKYEAAKEVAERLVTGAWNKIREGGGGGGGGLLLQALVNLYPTKSREELEEFISGKSKAEQSALRVNPKIAAEIAKIQSARAAIDSDDLLGELEG